MARPHINLDRPLSKIMDDMYAALDGYPVDRGPAILLNPKDDLDNVISTSKSDAAETAEISGICLEDKWEDVRINFVSHQTVRISTKKIDCTYHFGELGFFDRRHPDIASSRWELLKAMARHDGEAKHKDHLEMVVNIRDLKKAISDLRRILRGVFGIADDPFHPYKLHKSYKPKFVLNHRLLD